LTTPPDDATYHQDSCVRREAPVGLLHPRSSEFITSRARLPDQRPEHHQNSHQRRVRFDPVEQRTLDSRTLNPPAR
jgi:hypothetical protein